MFKRILAGFAAWFLFMSAMAAVMAPFQSYAMGELQDAFIERWWGCFIELHIYSFWGILGAATLGAIVGGLATLAGYALTGEWTAFIDDGTGRGPG